MLFRSWTVSGSSARATFQARLNKLQGYLSTINGMQGGLEIGRDKVLVVGKRDKESSQSDFGTGLRREVQDVSVKTALLVFSC